MFFEAIDLYRTGFEVQSDGQFPFRE